MKTEKLRSTTDRCNRLACKEIFDAIDTISYGEVVITIHDKRVVQVEKREKKRYS